MGIGIGEYKVSGYLVDIDKKMKSVFFHRG